MPIHYNKDKGTIIAATRDYSNSSDVESSILIKAAPHGKPVSKVCSIDYINCL